MFNGAKSTAADDASSRLLPAPVDPLSYFAADSLVAWGAGSSLVPFRELSPPADSRLDAAELVARASTAPLLPIETSRLMIHFQSDADLASLLNVPPSAMSAWMDQGNLDALYVFLSAVGMRSAVRLEP